MSYIEANKNTEQRTVIQMYRLQHAQANKSCDYNDDFYRASILMILEEMVLSEWKLKIIDSLEMSNELSKKERDEAINSLIDVNQLKNILTKNIFL
jgi:hypothetical protein